MEKLAVVDRVSQKLAVLHLDQLFRNTTPPVGLSNDNLGQMKCQSVLECQQVAQDLPRGSNKVCL